MARPPMPIGTWGKITRTNLGDGRWRARAKYRDFDGRTRLVERFGKTGAAAERALLEALRDRAKPTNSVTDITRDTTLANLADLWLAKRADEGITQQTLDGYSDIIRVHIKPGLGGVRVGEATVGRLDKFIRAVPGATSARHCRVVLSGMMKLAAQHDAIEHNPVRDTTIRKANRKPPRALPVEDLQRLRKRVAAWSGGNRMGPPRGQDIPDLFDVLAGTGARIGEALALRWSDVDFGGDERPATATIAGTVVENTRQDFPKTHASHRTVTLPDFTVAALRRQRARDLPTDQDLVFPGRHGGPRTTNNVRVQLRAARGYVEHEKNGDPKEFEWVTPHTFRRTAATIIERAVDADAAAGQLGHASPDVTRAHYVQRATAAPDLRHALDVLAPVVPVSDGLKMGQTKNSLPGESGKAV